MKLNIFELKNYLEVKGLTKIKVLNNYLSIPKNTILYFNYHNMNRTGVTTYNKYTNFLNEQFNYKFDYQYNWDSFKCNLNDKVFEVQLINWKERLLK